MLQVLCCGTSLGLWGCSVLILHIKNTWMFLTMIYIRLIIQCEKSWLKEKNTSKNRLNTIDNDALFGIPTFNISSIVYCNPTGSSCCYCYCSWNCKHITALNSRSDLALVRETAAQIDAIAWQSKIKPLSRWSFIFINLHPKYKNITEHCSYFKSYNFESLSELTNSETLHAVMLITGKELKILKLSLTGSHNWHNLC